MASCSDCQIAEQYGSSRLYDPACLECGRRYLRAIQQFPADVEWRRNWWKKALADWMAHGHSKAALVAPASATGTRPESTERTGRSRRGKR
jgi:hypothetical protein